jgi:glycosyltransferase involved in cell wall biosynthesis
MKVSIITISFNSAATIEDTIRSVVAQDYPNLEYIIVDGNSKDGTQEIVNRYQSSIAQFVSEPDKGIYDGMNKGLKLATGDIIGILNSDDIYEDTSVISDMVKLFESSHCKAAYADLVYVDRIDTSKVTRYWKSGAYKAGAFRKGWMPPHPTFFVRKSIYDQFGYFNLSLKSAADYEIMLRFIHKHGIQPAYLPRVITRMRSGGQSNLSIKNRIKANREDRKAWSINGIKPGLFTLIRKPLSKIFQFMKKGR